MNSSYYIILIFIAILVYFVYNNYHNKVENFYYSIDSVYAPLGIYGLKNTYNAIPINQYANQIAYDLDNPFPSSTTNNNKNNMNVPWNPVSYREVQEPDGQFVGILSQN
jgi:hypothetical protein